MKINNTDKELLSDEELFKYINRPRIRIPAEKDLGIIPLLRHIRRLTFQLPNKTKLGDIAAVGIYSRRYVDHNGMGNLWYLEAAKDSGYEGFACVDDTARAVVLASHIYERLTKVQKNKLPKEAKSKINQALKECKELVYSWNNFLLYMQEEDGKFTNFILDPEGTKNYIIEGSKPGGEAWTARALWALSSSYAVFKEKRWLQAYKRGFVKDMKDNAYKSLLIVAVLDILAVHNDLEVGGKNLEKYVVDWAESIMDCFDKVFYHSKIEGKLDKEGLHTYAYYEILGMAKAGAYFKNERYLKATHETVQNLAEKNARDGFYSIFPKQRDNSNLYGVSSIICGLSEMYSISKEGSYKFLESQNYYAYLALVHSLWMYRENDANAVMWFPNEGLCLDNTAIEAQGDISAGTACGAESAIEGGLVQLVINKLRNADKYLYE